MSALYPVTSTFARWIRRHADFEPGDDVPRYAGPTTTCEDCDGTGAGESGCHGRVSLPRCDGACPGCFAPVPGGCPSCKGAGEVPDRAQHCPVCWEDAGERTPSEGGAVCPDCALALADDVASCPDVPTHAEGCTCRRGLTTSGYLLGLTVTLAVSYLLACGVTAVIS